MSAITDSTLSGEIPRSRQARTLRNLVAHSRLLPSLDRGELQCGDRVVVKTRNSVYSLLFIGGNEYFVSGGWFDRRGISPLRTTVNGCTWGGTALKHDIVAAPGLFLEFGNGVKTTRIRSVQVIRAATGTRTH